MNCASQGRLTHAHSVIQVIARDAGTQEWCCCFLWVINAYKCIG